MRACKVIARCLVSRNGKGITAGAALRVSLALAGAAAFVLMLAGCSATRDAEKDVKAMESTVVSERAANPAPADPRLRDTVVVKNDAWLGSEAVPIVMAKSLPPELDRPDGVTLISPVPLSIYELASQISEATAAAGRPIQVRVGNLTGAGTATVAEPPAIKIDYRGPLSGLLDTVANRMGVSWAYRGGFIELYRFENRTFQIYALAVDSTVNAGVSNTASGTASTPSAGGASSGSSGGGGAATSTQQVNNASSVKIWDDVKTAIQGMLPQGSSFTASPATGTIDVTTTADAMRVVERYVKEQNVRLSRQVSIDVRLLSLQLTDGDNYGLDLTAAFQNSKGANLSMLGPVGTLATTANSLSIGIVSPPAGSSQAAWNGTKAAIQALSTVAHIAQQTGTTVVTVNNKPVPAQVLDQQTYLASVSTTLPTAANTAQTSTLTPGTVVTGWSMTALPRVLSGGRVELELSLNVSQLLAMNQYTSGGNSISAPDVDSRTFQNEVSLLSGETLVMAGFEQTNSNVSKQGVGSADVPVPGGTVVSTHSKTVMVLLVTPTVLKAPMSQPYAASLE
jgi:type IVB pilus formation R64 PilN family outer membrane protein